MAAPGLRPQETPDHDSRTDAFVSHAAAGRRPGVLVAPALARAFAGHVDPGRLAGVARRRAGGAAPGVGGAVAAPDAAVHPGGGWCDDALWPSRQRVAAVAGADVVGLPGGGGALPAFGAQALVDPGADLGEPGDCRAVGHRHTVPHLL